MAIAGSTWRKHSFTIGSRYRALVSFNSSGADSGFVAGREYCLLAIGHSHYDSCTILVFGAGGSRLEWWWGDEEPDSLCHERFSPLERSDTTAYASRFAPERAGATLYFSKLIVCEPALRLQSHGFNPEERRWRSNRSMKAGGDF